MKTDRTFGIEIELAGTIYNRHNTKLDVVCSLDSTQSWRDEYYEVQLQPGWKAVYDSTCGSEFVSPPLIDTSSIALQIAEIIESGYPIILDGAGLHIHVGVPDLSRYNLIELVKFCRHFERAIYSFVHPSRWRNEFCGPSQFSNETLLTRYDPLKRLRNSQRYVGCNIVAYDKHSTVEYRYSESTMDYEKICALIDFFIKITSYVADNKGSTRKGKTPRKTKEKRKYLLKLIGVSQTTFKKLIDTKY